MHPLKTNDPLALQLFLTEDIYLIPDKEEDKEDKSHKMPESPRGSFEYLGQNKAHFLVLIEDPKHSKISPNILNLLLKIMQAKGLDIDDIAIVNYSCYPNTCFNELKLFFACDKLTLLGIDPQSLKLPSLAINQIHLIEQVQILPSCSLDEMNADQDKKRQFWNVMKHF